MRGLNPMSTPLVVADSSRGDGAIVLAITPYLKSLGVKNRCRLFEIDKNIKYITALPRMKYYIRYTTKIYEILASFVAPEDIHVYSIDESFVHIAPYLKYYHNSPQEMGIKLMNKINQELKIHSACGAGTNMFLAKVALDIKAKHTQFGFYYFDEEKFINEMWNYKELTDIWQIGPGTKRRLSELGMYTLKDIALSDEKILSCSMGVIGRELYNRAWGRDDCTMNDIKDYTPLSTSINRTQIMFRDYTKKEAIIPLLEMLFLVCLEMNKRNSDCLHISMFVGYSKEYNGASGKTITLDYRSNSYFELSKIVKQVYCEIVYDLPIRSMGISAGSLSVIKNRQISLFNRDNIKDRVLLSAINEIHKKHGKNSLIPALGLLEESTLIYRNKTIGGHNSE
ncbi:MAG: hypothetical protein J6R47_01920 [Acholeplasmatales bacterium]|nr:hypothetical protein [Acholeplasmatales bacterium]